MITDLYEITPNAISFHEMFRHLIFRGGAKSFHNFYSLFVAPLRESKKKSGIIIVMKVKDKQYATRVHIHHIYHQIELNTRMLSFYYTLKRKWRQTSIYYANQWRNSVSKSINRLMAHISNIVWAMSFIHTHSSQHFSIAYIFRYDGAHMRLSPSVYSK